jgi:hypothetical protein
MATKEQLLREIIAEHFAQSMPDDQQSTNPQCVRDIVARNIDDQLKALVAVRPLLQLGLLHAGMFSPLDLHNPTLHGAISRERRTRQIIQLQQDGQIRDTISADALSRYFDLVMGAAVAEWLLSNNSDVAPLKSALEQAISLFLNGIEIRVRVTA